MDAQALARYDLFASTSLEQREAIRGLLVEERFAAGSRIFSEGEPGDRLFMVAEGVVRISTVVSDGEEALAMLRPGAYFGEMSVIDSQPRSADAFAHEDVVVWSLGRDQFTDLLHSDAQLAVAVLGTMARILSVRLRETNDQVKALHLLSMW